MHDYMPALEAVRKTSAGKAESVSATGLIMADSSVLVLDSRSGTARSTGCLYMSCTARLLLFFPTTLLF